MRKFCRKERAREAQEQKEERARVAQEMRDVALREVMAKQSEEQRSREAQRQRQHFLAQNLPKYDGHEQLDTFLQRFEEILTGEGVPTEGCNFPPGRNRANLLPCSPQFCHLRSGVLPSY